LSGSLALTSGRITVGDKALLGSYVALPPSVEIVCAQGEAGVRHTS